MLLLVNFNAKGQEIKNKPIKPARKVALIKDKSVLPVLQLKSNNRFKKELLNAPLKPKTFTLSSLLLESKSKKTVYSGVDYMLSPLKLKDRNGAFLLFNGQFDGLAGVIKITPYERLNEAANPYQKLDLFMPTRNGKTYKVMLKFEANYDSKKCKNAKIAISNGGYAVKRAIKKGENIVNLFTISEYTGRTIINLLNYTLVSCNDQRFSKDRHGDLLQFLFKSVEVKELKN